jgi:hypothetical protein
MNTNILLDKLIEIERSIGVETNTTLRKQVLDAQDCVLEMQREMVENLRKGPRRFVLEPFPSSTYAA